MCFPANTDVSWLLTVAERVLDGQRPYVEIIETNPPIAPLTYATRVRCWIITEPESERR